jgi:hypothetical protein
MHDLLLALATAEVPIDEQHVRPGWIAMVVVGLLILATVVLMRSFVKHARRAREPWPGEDDDPTSSP